VEPDHVVTQLSSQRNIAVQHPLQLQTYPSRLHALHRRTAMLGDPDLSDERLRACDERSE